MHLFSSKCPKLASETVVRTCSRGMGTFNICSLCDTFEVH